MNYLVGAIIIVAPLCCLSLFYISSRLYMAWRLQPNPAYAATSAVMLFCGIVFYWTIISIPSKWGLLLASILLMLLATIQSKSKRLTIGPAKYIVLVFIALAVIGSYGNYAWHANLLRQQLHTQQIGIAQTISGLYLLNYEPSVNGQPVGYRNLSSDALVPLLPREAEAIIITGSEGVQVTTARHPEITNYLLSLDFDKLITAHLSENNKQLVRLGSHRYSIVSSPLHTPDQQPLLLSVLYAS